MHVRCGACDFSGLRPFSNQTIIHQVQISPIISYPSRAVSDWSTESKRAFKLHPLASLQLSFPANQSNTSQSYLTIEKADNQVKADGSRLQPK
jgi:hypothetical protein